MIIPSRDSQITIFVIVNTLWRRPVAYWGGGASFFLLLGIYYFGSVFNHALFRGADDGVQLRFLSYRHLRI